MPNVFVISPLGEKLVKWVYLYIVLESLGFDFSFVRFWLDVCWVSSPKLVFGIGRIFWGGVITFPFYAFSVVERLDECIFHV